MTAHRRNVRCLNAEGQLTQYACANNGCGKCQDALGAPLAVQTTTTPLTVESAHALVNAAYEKLHAQCGCGALTRDWRSKATGRLYSVQSIVLQEADLVPLVIHRVKDQVRGQTSPSFARPIDEFVERFEVIVEPVRHRPYRNELTELEALRKRLAQVLFGKEPETSAELEYDKVCGEFSITKEDAER